MRNRHRFLIVAILAAPALYLACGDDDVTNPPATNDAGSDGSSTDSPTGDTSTPDTGVDTGTDAGIARGPVSLPFDPTGNGDPISMLWNDTKKILYIADNKNNQLWTWTDADGFKKLAKVLANPLADDAGRTNLGQIVQMADGTLVVPRFGFGGINSVSGLLYVDPATGDAGEVPGLDPIRKRVALAVGTDGQLWGGYFFTPGDGLGVVNKYSFVDESDYATGFEKPVSVLVQDGNLLVSEQQRGIIYKLPLDGGFAAGGPYDVFANVASCDTLTPGPGGSVITGQFRPLSDGGPLQIRQAFPDGGVKVLFPTQTFAKPQGVAFDKTNKRLFVADSNGTTVRTIKILPID